MQKYIKKPVKVEAVEFEDTADSIYKITRLAGDQIIKIRFKNDSPVLHIPTKEGEMIARVGDYIIKGVEGEIYACKPRIFVKTYTPVDIAEEGRKVKKMSEMVTKSGINFTEKGDHHKKEKIEKVESFEFHFDGKTKSKIKYSTIKDGSRYHTERVFSNFELDDNLREELQSIIGRISEYFFENDKTLPMIEHTGITNAKIHNIPAGVITGINADFSGAKLDIPVKTAKIKDLSADKITAGNVNDIGGAGTLPAESIRKTESSNVGKIPVVIHVDPKEVARACWEEFHNTMKRQDMRSK